MNRWTSDASDPQSTWELEAEGRKEVVERGMHESLNYRRHILLYLLQAAERGRTGHSGLAPQSTVSEARWVCEVVDEAVVSVR